MPIGFHLNKNIGKNSTIYKCCQEIVNSFKKNRKMILEEKIAYLEEQYRKQECQIWRLEHRIIELKTVIEGIEFHVQEYKNAINAGIECGPKTMIEDIESQLN